VQTFLPDADFTAAAAALDSRRLGKQRAETLQVLRALVWPRYGWKNHPAVAMWRGFTRALVCYGAAVCREWTARGYTDATLPSLLLFTGGSVPGQAELAEQGLLPPWLGDPALHLAHRSALVRKEPEHYRPLFPEVPDDLPMFWPRPVFPRWPLRRGGREPLEPGEAAVLLGSGEASAAQHEVVRTLRAGRDAEVRGEEVPLAGVLAGLCTPGRTWWLVPGPRPVLGVPPPVPSPEPVVCPPPRPSVTRQPGPEELAAQEAEWRHEPEFLFHRVPPGTRPPDPPTGIGLVVVEGASLPRPRVGVPVLRLLAG